MLASAVVWIFFTLAALLFYRLCTGRLQTRGLLSASPASGIAPERVQALVVTVGTAASYAASALHSTAPTLSSLPDVPAFLVNATLASQVLYLAGKLVRTRPSGDQ